MNREITYTHPTLNPLSLINWLRHESQVTLKQFEGDYAISYAFIPCDDTYLYVELKTDGENEVFIVTSEFDSQQVYPYLTTRLAYVAIQKHLRAN